MHDFFLVGGVLAVLGYMAGWTLRKTGAKRTAYIVTAGASALIKLLAAVGFFYLAVGAVERGGGWMIAIAVGSVILGACTLVFGGAMLYYRVFRARPKPDSPNTLGT
jgi:hypothetical protein